MAQSLITRPAQFASSGELPSQRAIPHTFRISNPNGVCFHAGEQNLTNTDQWNIFTDKYECRFAYGATVQTSFHPIAR
jgi:hypothetical protein